MPTDKQETIKIVKEYLKGDAFKDRKVTDTPTDALQVTPKKYVDGLVSGGTAGQVFTSNGAGVLGSFQSSSAGGKVPIIGAMGAGTGASSTQYINNLLADATEANILQIWPLAGTIKNLYVKTTTAQPASGDYVITARKNSADTAVTLTISANAGAGTFSDTSNSFTIAAGDTFDIKCTNGASATSAVILTYGFEFDPT